MTNDSDQPVGYTEKEIFKRLLKLSWKYRGGCLKAVVMQGMLLSLTIGGLNLAGVGIDFIRKAMDTGAKEPIWLFGLAPPAEWSVLQVLFFISGLSLGIACVRYYLNYAYKISMVRFLQQGIVVDLRSRVYERMQRLSFRFLDSRTSGTLINRVTGDVQAVRLFVDGVMVQGVIICLSLAIYLAYMLSINTTLTLISTATIPLMFFYSRQFSKKVRPEYIKSRDMMDSLIFKMVERIQGIHVVKGFAREEQELKLLGDENDAVRDQKRKIILLTSIFTPSIGMLSHVSIMILLAYGGYLVIEDVLPLGSGLIVFLGLLNRFSEQVNSAANIVDNVQQSVAAAGRVFEVLDTPIEIKSPQNAVRLDSCSGKVEFRNVSFEYTPGEKVLDNISFKLEKGQFVGILGTTGAGKSTLLSLIPRFYDTGMGAVMIDGYDVRRLKIGSLRRQVGIVFQESFLFSNTIAANIAFGHPGAERGRIETAAKLASAHEFISALPKGYDAVIGESGCDLSGGQRQRLAIARAILLDPPILLLDDPTASVDSQTEKEILQGIESAMKGRTTFLVSHRIGVLMKADIILVMHKGQIVQKGTHEELMKTKGHYRQTADIQIDTGESVNPAGTSKGVA
ncbi:MAG: ABC transporter ATP-binding protein [Victivallales bacterium]|nr:ABC transporter ATP-binding protein [Victivallales bacterium]